MGEDVDEPERAQQEHAFAAVRARRRPCNAAAVRSRTARSRTRSTVATTAGSSAGSRPSAGTSSAAASASASNASDPLACGNQPQSLRRVEQVRAARVALVDPTLDVAVELPGVHEFDGAVERHPAMQRAVHELARVGADLPDAVVGLAPSLDRDVDEAGEEPPVARRSACRRRGRTATPPRRAGRSCRAGSAWPRRCRCAPAPSRDGPRRWSSVDLGQVGFAADAVHDLQLVGMTAGRCARATP